MLRVLVTYDDDCEQEYDNVTAVSFPKLQRKVLKIQHEDGEERKETLVNWDRVLFFEVKNVPAT